MLASHTVLSVQRRQEIKPGYRQRGVVLLITLIVLVAMTLAAISLVRSVDTTNVIAGNLAFREGATVSGDRGTEAAVAWLEQNNGSTLWAQNAFSGYYATFQPLAANETWDQFWSLNAVARGFVTLAADNAGNTVSYMIERMCQQPLDPNDPNAGCSKSTVSVSSGSSQTSQAQTLTSANQIYYRITSRIDGPRNTVSYIQAMVAL